MRGRNGLGHKDKPFKNVLDKKYEQINEIEMCVVYLQGKLMQYIFLIIMITTSFLQTFNDNILWDRIQMVL